MLIRTTVVCLALQLVAPMARLTAQEPASPAGDVQPPREVVSADPPVERPTDPEPTLAEVPANTEPERAAAAHPVQDTAAQQPRAANQDRNAPPPSAPAVAAAIEATPVAQPIAAAPNAGSQLATQRFAVEVIGGANGTRLALNGANAQGGPMRVDSIAAPAGSPVGVAAREQPMQLAQDAQGRSQFDLPRGGGTFILKQSSTTPTTVGAVGAMVALPMLIVDAQPKPNGRSGLNVVMGTPMLQMSRRVDWDAKAQTYVAEYLFWLAAANLADAVLSRAVWATFTTDCAYATPQNQGIARLGQESAVRITLSCTPNDKKSAATHQLYVSLGKSTETIPFTLPALYGTPKLEVSPSSVYGWGLQKLRVTVTEFAVDGNALKAAEDTTFNLNFAAFDGDIPPLKIAAGSSQGSVEIRPRGLGQLSFHASGADRRTDEHTIELRWPIGLLLAVILGGGLGGCVSLFGKGQRHRLMIRTAEGVLVALLACALFIVFPELISLEPNQSMGEIVVFGLSGASGFVGATLIDRVTKVLFRLPAAAPEAEKPGSA